MKKLIKISVFFALSINSCNLFAASKEETLGFLESAFQSCNDVESVERGGSNFRIYFKYGLAEQYQEFDLSEMKFNGSINGVGSIPMMQCNMGSCVKQYGSNYYGKWEQLKPATGVYFMCDGYSEKIARALSYFSNNYSKGEPDF